jgi:hypothetical protein
MPSSNRTKILTGTSQCLAAAAIIAGLAFGGAGIANADYSKTTYDSCMGRPLEPGHDPGLRQHECCAEAGGWATLDNGGFVNGCGPKYLNQSAPTDPTGKPGVVPPLVDAPQAPAAPGQVFTPIPRAPNSGQG